MTIGSVYTNLGAQVALRSLGQTDALLQSTEKQIITGFRVADPVDDGAAFSVAQNVRADTGALSAVDVQLGHAKGLIGTTLSTLTALSSSLSTVKSLLIKIGDASSSSNERSRNDVAFESLIKQVADVIDEGNFDGQTLVGRASGAVAGTGSSVVSNEGGSVLSLAAEDASNLPTELAALIGSTFSRSPAGVDSFATIAPGSDQAAALTALTATFGVQSFSLIESGLDNQLNETGAESNLLDATVTSNKGKIDSLNAGLGDLVDANLSKDSAELQAFQIRQRLATQSLGQVNQDAAPLLTLLKA